MLAACKIRAVPINVNYRYVEEELGYLFDDADLVARRPPPGVHAHAGRGRRPGARSCTPSSRVADDSGVDMAGARTTEDYEAALAAASAERDFPERSGDDLYILYTGGTTGMPKGVMWRQEDIFFAAIGPARPWAWPSRPASPEDLADRVEGDGGTLTMATAAPLMHGAAQWAAFMLLPPGQHARAGRRPASSTRTASGAWSSGRRSRP